MCCWKNVVEQGINFIYQYLLPLVRLIEGKEQCYTAGEQTIDLTGFDNLASGIYFLKLDFNGTKVVKKISVE
jgi:hypothetical protein